MTTSVRVVIVGGGASGTLAAVHLLAGHRSTAREIVLVERAAVVGRGAAYSTTCRSHLLNVPAGSMSARADDPGHFVRWLRRSEGSWTSSSFAPRMLYGAYLADVLAEAEADCPPEVTLRRVQADVVAVTDSGGPTVHLGDGRTLPADDIIVAVGNQRPAPLRGGAGRPRYLGDPWDPDALGAVGADDHVAVVGTGLTAIDAMLTLRDGGHRGRITAMSRRGWLPQVHDLALSCACVALPAELTGSGSHSAGELVGAVRRRVATAADEGHDWRAVIDALRPVTAGLWQELPEAEQKRFARHVARSWDVHRHRIAPEVATVLTELRSQGRLEVLAGRVRRIEEEQGHLRVVVGGHPDRTVDADWVVNCTGPSAGLHRDDGGLLGQMATAGLIGPHPSGLGAAAGADGALRRADGRPVGWLWTLGPLLKGALWESIAVPEIRDQAAALAATLHDRHSARSAT